MTEAYKGHRAGSSKGLVHKKFDEAGADAAIKLAVQKGLAETTARTWCSFWKNNKGGAKKAAPKTAKAKKAAPKKTVAKAAPKRSAKKAPAQAAA